MCPLTFLETSLSDWRANELICIFSPPIVLCQKLCNGKIENFTAWMCKCGQSDACLCVWMEKKTKHGASRQTEQNKRGIVDVSRDKTHNLTDPTDSSVCWEWNVCVNHSLTMPKSFLQSILCLFKIKKFKKLRLKTSCWLSRFQAVAMVPQSQSLEAKLKVSGLGSV